MSKKNLYKAYIERGKKKNPYYRCTKLNGGTTSRNTLSLEDVYELEDELTYRSTFYELKRWKKEYYTDEFDCNSNILHRLVSSYVDKHISELHKKCMSYPSKYRHSIWKYALRSINDEFYISEDGKFHNWFYFLYHYLDEEGFIRRCPSYEEYKDNWNKNIQRVNIYSLPHRNNWYYLYPFLNGYKQYYYLENEEGVYNHLMIKEVYFFHSGKDKSNYASIEGWYSLRKEVTKITKKELILRDGKYPIWVRDTSVIPHKTYAAYRTITNESIRYELIYDKWESKQIPPPPLTKKSL